MAGASTEIGTAVLPVILSFEGLEAQVKGKLSKTFGDVGKQASKALADGSEADIKRATEAYAKFKNKAEDALGKVRVEEEKLAAARAKGNNAQIVAAEERLNKARRDSATANRAAAASYKDVTDAQKRLGDSTKDTGGAFGGMGDMLGGVVEKMGGLAGIAAGAATAIGVVGAAAIAGARELYNLGASFDEVSDKLAIKTGAVGANLEALQGAVATLAPNTASTITEIGNVVGSVSQALGLTDDQLTTVSKTILDLDRMTGQQTNVRELGKAWTLFGVAAKDQVGTLDQLMQASQATGLDVNSLISTLTKGGPALKALGLTFGESAALMSTFENAGLDADKALGGLGIALRNLAKDGKDPKVALAGTVDEINKLITAGREADAITLASSVFGKGYLPFFEAIKTGNLDVNSLNQSLQNNGSTISGLSASTEDWAEKWQKVKNAVQTAISPAASVFFETINKELGKLGDWVINNQDTVIDFFVGLGNAAITATEFVVKSIGKMARGIGDIIAPIGDAMGAMLKFDALMAKISGDTERAKELERQSEEFFSMGEGLKSFADAAESFNADELRAGLNEAGKRAKEAAAETKGLGAEVEKLNGKKIDIPVSVNVTAARTKLDGLPAELGAALGGGATAAPSAFAGRSGRSFDEALLANVPAGRYAQVQNADLTKGLADCTSSIEDLVAIMDGNSTGGRSMATGNAQEWLESKGFKRTDKPMPGTFQVGYFDGPGNEGHMQATLPGGTKFNWGSDASAAKRGIGNAGAWEDSRFTHHYYRPVAGGAAPADNKPIPVTLETPSGTPVITSPIDKSRLNDSGPQQQQIASLLGGQQGKGAGDLSPLGGIFSSFLKESTGIDISGLMPLQMLGTAMSSGIQMSTALAQYNASAAPFGIPEIGAPPMPTGGAHGGLGGLPGPATIVNVDNSQNLQGANLGWDPAQVEKQRQANINRSPRLPVGIG